MIARLDKIDLEPIKIRERIAIAVRMRLEGLSGQKEALRRSILKSSPRHLYKTVDLIWRRAGDKAVDFNFYSSFTTDSVTVVLFKLILEHTSSIISIALSGKKRSFIYLSLNSTQALIASFDIFTLW